MSRLFERLDSLPVELEDLFMQIIESINVPEPADATKIFQIVMAKPQWQRTFLTLSHTLEEHADYALNLVSHAMTQRALKHRISLMRRRLNRRCKGFLEVGSKVNCTPWADWHIEFLHRHVPRRPKQGIANADLVLFMISSAGAERCPTIYVYASRVQFLALTDVGVFNATVKGVDVEKRALTLTLSVVDWASHKERDTKSPPSHLLAVLRHMMVERLPHWGIHKLAKSLEREACEAPGAFYIFKRWE
ncbi:hypothetical protein PV11_03804 [Exophiala sideris]|uniref:DUF7791 domain-containing protein n=1 Tax=Exophiala sideris TaxID=1016849 RepID=A0A0D1YKR8_9EURO|nr:hypothetical protein PV11_03804 [Exophiala sideris]